MKDKHVFITGGTSGIGLATARRFRDLGANVSAVGRRKKTEPEILFLSADLSTSEGVTDALISAKTIHGNIDILVNCVGIFNRKSIIEIQASDWRKTLDTNLTSYYFTSRAVVLPMIRQGWGRIINVSSIAGLSYSKTGGVDYSVSKAGVIAMTKHLAAELGEYGITVNCVCPGQTDTEMLNHNFTLFEKEQIARAIPAGYVSIPKQQASVITFLASDAADYVNGAVINVSGGQQ